MLRSRTKSNGMCANVRNAFIPVFKPRRPITSKRISFRLYANVRFCNGPVCQAVPVYPVAGILLLSVVS